MEIPDLRRLNSATKYPSIPTHHKLDPTNGNLLDEATSFPPGAVIATEKIDGTNARIIVPPGGPYLIGSREELLHAGGDLIHNPALGIVEALGDVAERAYRQMRRQVGVRQTVVFYLELYGAKSLPAWKHYGTGEPAWRLFDIAGIPPDVLDQPVEWISGWRDGGGQHFRSEVHLELLADAIEVELVPRLVPPAGAGRLSPADLPAGIAAMREFLQEMLPHTMVGPGQAEGVVFRTAGRTVITKARFQDYDRTLRRQAAAAAGRE